MKALVCLSFFCLIISDTYSQKLDLIVMSNGDSLACRIDSISDKKVYFEMRHNYSWIHTDVNKSDCSEYSVDVIDEKLAVYRPGTSYLMTSAEQQNLIDAKVNNRFNSIYFENQVILPGINYDRIFPISKKAGIVIKAGLFFYGGTYLIMEGSLLLGAKKHFLEIGTGWGGEDMLGLYGRMTYRYMGKHGLMFKGGIITVRNIPIFPSFGLGFSF